MEPLDAARNDEGIGSSRRRISSILKAPRRSIRFSEAEQQENVVECAKPVEKRNSRRVSFAPANDVLLFSKDVKNTSSASGPLQDIITTADMQNRAQVAVTEDQQIMGMETLLNAPLHASQHRDKVHFDFGDVEKTSLFSPDDAFMDMTYSHTMNITNDADNSLLNCDSLPVRGEKRERATLNDGEKTPSCLDPEFQNFVASLSKSSGPSVSPLTRVRPATDAPSEETNRSLVQIKTQSANVDKENQAPTSVSAVMENSLNPSRKIGELSHRSAHCPEDDSHMDMTECHTQAFTDNDDPFQCLFPTQEMYSSINNKASQMAEKTTQQQTIKTQTSFNPKDMTSLKNPSLHASHQRHMVNLDTKDESRDKTAVFTAGDEFMDMTQSHTVNTARCSVDHPNQNLRKHDTCVASRSSVTDLDLGFKNFLSSLCKPSIPSGDPARMVPSTAAPSKETIYSSRSLSQLKSDAGKESLWLNPTRSSGESFIGGTICPESDVSIDMTEAHTGRIIVVTSSDDAFQVLSPNQDNRHCESVKKQEMTSVQKNSEVLRSSNHSGLETSLKTKVQRNPAKFDPEDDCRDKTVRFSADDASTPAAAHPYNSSGDSSNGHTVCPGDDVRMDLTEALTGCILGITGAADDPHLLTQEKYPHSGSLKKVDMTSLGSSNCKGMDTALTASLKTKVERQQVTFDDNDCREKTVRFTFDDAAMDVTRSHTVNIGAEFKLQSHNNLDSLPACGEKTVRFSANDATMDVTRSHTVNIDAEFELQSHSNLDSLPACGEKTVRFSANDATMDVTRSHTVNIDAEFELQSHNNLDNLPACGEKGVRFSANDATMDVTRSHTVNIDAEFKLQSHNNLDNLPACGEETVRFSANDATMDVTRSHTVNIDAEFELQSHNNLDNLPACGEKAVRFSANDATMDVTRSHTVNIDAEFELQSHNNLDNLPACGEETVRFSANDATMDVTRSHTVNIDAEFKLQSHNNLDNLPACGEKAVRFSANDATMDVTRSHTVNIDAEFELQSHNNLDNLPACGEKAVRFSANDATMDVTRSHTVNIDAEFELQSHSNLDNLPACGEKTERFTADDACMDVTRSHTMSIDTNSVLESLLPHRDSDILSTQKNMDCPLSAKKTGRPCRNRSSSALTLDPGIKNSLSRKSGLWSNSVITKVVAPAAPSPQKSVDADAFLDQLKTETPDVDTVSAVMEKSVNKTMTECLENMDMTEGQTGHILEETYVDEPPQSLSSTQDSKKTELTSQQSNEALGSSSPDGMEIPNLPDSPYSNETSTRNEPQPRNHTCSLSQKTEQLLTGVDVDAQLSQRSRRMSLANLQSKVRRLSHLINTAPDTAAMDSRTAPLPSLERDMDKTSDNKTQSHPPVTEPEHEMGLVNTEEDNQAPSQPSPLPTPFNLKTKQLMSRLSVGNFKAKLPQRSKPDDPKKTNYAGEHTRTVTVSVTNQLSNFDDLSNIYNEELGSCEDLSEALGVNPQEDKVSAAHEFNRDELMEDNGCEQDFTSTVHGKKRPLPVEEVDMKDEKRMKTSTEVTSDVETFGLVECNGNMSTAASSTTQTTDYSNSSRCEVTFESTLKQSMFESQLEDYNNDLQRKLDDGTMTVSEFFKLFNIDFVIHNPRQSILPGRRMSDADRTPMDLLKDRHINRPKQMVYETDVLHLAEVVEGLKERMQDLDKPLKTVNLTLWEEVRNSSGQELKSFGAKLKERNNFFRKPSKARLRDMKETLYLNLVQANLEEQQRLTGKIEEADEMMTSLDDCIRGLEAELAAVEEKGFEDKPSLRTLQEEMQKVTEALANNERQTAELELQKEQSLNKVKRLRAETRDLESHIAALHLVNEWKLAEKTDDGTVFTFLHETLHLELVYGKSNGNYAANQSERKISHIALKLQLDDEKSQGHACLVHKLLSQFIEGTNNWVEKYSTRGHVPKLLHDVGLVVSRCRLLGEELRLLKMWGGLRLDILSISCVDTQVHIIFSSLKTFSKFELIFFVTLIDRLYVLQMHSFKNMIGDTKIQQIEEIVASFRPGKNLLTKIMKKIHERLLC